MNVLVIDGQGGGLGRQLVAALSAQCPDIRLVAVGTNSVAAQAMHKAGAQRAATGENAVVVNCRNADIIVPNGGENTAAVEMLAHHIRNLIEKANMM